MAYRFAQFRTDRFRVESRPIVEQGVIVEDNFPKNQAASEKVVRLQARIISLGCDDDIFWFEVTVVLDWRTGNHSVQRLENLNQGLQVSLPGSNQLSQGQT